MPSSPNQRERKLWPGLSNFTPKASDRLNDDLVSTDNPKNDDSGAACSLMKRNGSGSTVVCASSSSGPCWLSIWIARKALPNAGEAATRE